MTILNNVIGQDRAKQMLHLLGEGFSRKQKLPAIGVFGPSGLGKTHLVTEFAAWINAELIYINGTAIKDPLAFRSYIKEAGRNSQKYHIVFIDECHNLPRKVQENLLSVLEEPAVLCTVAPKEVGNVRCVDGVRFIDKGDVMREALPPNISFVLATTDPVMLKESILNRLRKIHLAPYTLEEKAEIAMGHLVNNGVRSDMALYVALAQRSRSIRHLKSDLCETYIDIEQLFEDDNQDERLFRMDEMLGTDEDGATCQDLDYLEYIANNKIAGVDTLAGVLKTDKKDIVHRIEPFLLEKGWITITGKGRILTALGRKKMLCEDGGEGVDALTTE